MDKKNENKAEQNEQPKKCFCSRCFLPIEPEDKVDVDGQSFHRMCSTCCICRQIPTSIKMFYGHVFCNECFKTHVLNRFKGEPQRMHSNSWWMQWAPGMKAQGPETKEDEEKNEAENEKDNEKEEDKEKPAAPKTQSAETPKRCFCARCLQAVDDKNKVEIGGQCFHTQCAKCYFCHAIPKDKVKIYYGQVFCEDCFNRFVMAKNKDTPAEHFRNCFDQMQNNGQFADGMREFMAGKEPANPIIFMMQGAHPPFCRCGNHQAHAREWLQANEPRKSAVTPATPSIGEDSFGTWDLSFENRTEVSDLHESRSRESANQENLIVAAAEKIEKLTKYLQDNFDSEKYTKKWKNFIDGDKFRMVSEMDPSEFPWINLQDPKIEKAETCPKCLWQCGPIFVNGDYFQKEVLCSGENFDQ